MTPAVAERIEEQVRGEVIAPGSEEYDEARAVYNAMIDRKPALVVRARDEADVVATVRLARDADLDLAVRGGAHGVPGYGTCDGGIVLDMSSIRNVHVDPARKTARVGGGAVLGDLDHATHAFGLATPAGFISSTGVAGLTLGGGIGPYLSRRFGLTCDNLLSARVVTADGRLVIASEEENAGLFWALRGGGGNFGVVTEMELRLHAVSEVVGGLVLFEADAAEKVMRFYREYFPQAPRELGGFFGFHIAPPEPFVPEARQGTPVCVIVPCWSGDPRQAEEHLDAIRGAGPVVAEHVGRMPYPVLQSVFDEALPAGLQHYWKADFVRELTDEAIQTHLEHGPRVPCVNSAVHLYPVDGAVHDVPPDATAFAHRDARFVLNIAGIWPDPRDNAANTAWVRDYYAAVHPFSGFDGGYTNFMTGDDETRVRENYGSSYERLSRIKGRWDPENLFHLNQNVKPASARARAGHVTE